MRSLLMFSSNHTLFFLFALVLHVTGILFISNQTKRQKDITMARLEISAVELNLTDATEDSQPSPPPPPTPEQKKPEPEPVPPEPTPIPKPPEPKPEPKPEPIPIIEKEPEPVVLPKKEPEPKPEPQKPKVETQPKKPPPKIVEKVAEVKDPPPKTNLKPMPESDTPESGAAAAQINMPPKPRRKIKPRYPSGARRRGEEGSVTLNVRINASGRAVDVEITQSSGFPELDQAAKHAVQKARFAPGTIDDRAVESQAGLTIIFKLR